MLNRMGGASVWLPARDFRVPLVKRKVTGPVLNQERVHESGQLLGAQGGHARQYGARTRCSAPSAQQRRPSVLLVIAGCVYND